MEKRSPMAAFLILILSWCNCAVTAKPFCLKRVIEKKGSPVKGQPVLRNYAQLRLKKAEEGNYLSSAFNASKDLFKVATFLAAVFL